MRYFLQFTYKGTNYRGWQIQPNASTVQEKINTVLSTRLRVPIKTTGSGRTDAGVHASDQYLHFDFDGELDPLLLSRANKLLPHDIRLLRIIPVKDDAHVRFDASRREYTYFVSQKKQPFHENQYYWFTPDLDIDAMNEASKTLLNHTNFECFCKVNTEVNTFNCVIEEAYWERKGEFVIFHIAADRFLRGMVRAIVGTILEIGTGRESIDSVEKIIISKSRKEAGRAVPADGLFLSKVLYPYID